MLTWYVCVKYAIYQLQSQIVQTCSETLKYYDQETRFGDCIQTR